jgi:hypothetical protein
VSDTTWTPTDLQPGDRTVVGTWLVEYVGEHTCAGGTVESNGAHEPGCGYEPLINLDGMTLAEKVAVIIDPTAALATPEVVYRVNHGETAAEAAERLRAEVMETARAVLVAVGPMIAASALRDAAATQDEESTRLREAFRQHNAHRDPNRPPRRPDLNTWANADEATAHRLRARADQIEKEAGR